MKVAQVLPQTHLMEGLASKKAKSIIEITKELNVKPISISETISDALKIKSNNGLYFDGKTPTGNIERNANNVIDFIV